MQTNYVLKSQTNHYEILKHNHCLMNKKLPFLFRVNKIYPLIIAVLLMTLQLQVFAQNTRTKITGTITDVTTGQALVGVSVSIKGTTKAAITDANGAYSIQVLPAEKALVFTFIGMKKQEIAIGTQTVINVVMEAESNSLNEIVVVAYGTQKKATLTGSVTQVKGDEVIAGKATTSVAEALQGVIPGLTITRTSSRPGNEGINIVLEGGISVNAVAPMIVIDGIDSYSWELSQLNPNDIENVSVLKDAAASIYGTRAAGGVILITTKRGKEGKIKVSYTGSSHMNTIANHYPAANGVMWAQMSIDAINNDARSGLAPNWWLFTQDEYTQLAAGKIFTRANGTLYFNPYANQFDAIYGTTYGQEHNVSISGGSDKARVFTSFGYAQDRSLDKVRFDGSTKYNFRTNLDYDISKWIKAQANVSYDKRITATPTVGVGEGIQDMWIFPLTNPKGQYYDAFGSNNLLAKQMLGGTTTSTESFTRLGGKLTLDMGFISQLKGLSFSALGAIKERKGWLVARNTQVTMYDWNGELQKPNNIFFQTAASNLAVQDTYAYDLYQNYGVQSNYVRNFNKHHLSLMISTTSEEEQYNDLMGRRTYMAADNLDALNTGNASYSTNSGNAYAYGVVSYLGKLNYDYNETYLLEGTFRRDGSSKLSPSNRWADFAGVSAGVVLTKYDFMKNVKFLNFLKLRASYGEAGSLSGIGNYDYLSGISTSTTVFGTTPAQVQTAWVTSMTSTNRTWERVATTNFGLDFTVLNNRLSGSIDYFNRNNIGMLIPVTYPSVLGASAPASNSGFFTSKGFNLSLNWKDQVGSDFKYNVGFVLSNAQTNVTRYPGAVAINNGLNSVIAGKPINSIYVYRTSGYLQTEADVTAYYAAEGATGTLLPVYAPATRLLPGTVKKLDLNGDGKITTADLSYYGDANPHYNFGFNINASYKGFDFSAFFQGIGQQYVLRTGALAYPFSVSYQNINGYFQGKTWTATNPNAPYPVLSRTGSINSWDYGQFNDINVDNVSYMRCKNMMIGYTIPTKYVSKLKLEKVRIWLSGNDLFDISNVKDGFDPEYRTSTTQGNIDVYARTYSLGIDVTF